VPSNKSQPLSLVDEFKKNPSQFYGVIFAVILIIVVRVWVRRRSVRTRDKDDKKEVESKADSDVQVTSLFIYPIKSCKGIQIDSATVGKFGFENDRKWMVVDATTKRFVTQRQYPKMALIVPTFKKNGKNLVVNAPDMPTFAIPNIQSSDYVTVSVWKSEGPAVDEGDDAAAWFSKYIKADVRLVRIPDDHQRTVPDEYKQPDLDNLVGYADGFPFLLASEESLEDLNKRIATKQLPMQRFRPNIIVKSSKGEGIPFMEDTWKKIQIGGVKLRVVKMCTRCKLTTVDPAKGQFDGDEPLATLSKYRKGLLKGSEEVCFAQNLIHENVGEIRVGQKIKVLE